MSAVLFSCCSNPGLAHLTVKTYFPQLWKSRLHRKRAVKKSAQKFGIWAVLERSTLRAISGAKINFLARFKKKT
jgi:hypothetical protein